MMRQRMDFRMDAEFKGFITEIRTILQDNDTRKGRGRKVSEADAVRFALKFTHKQLTDVLNPEDLRDD